MAPLSTPFSRPEGPISAVRFPTLRWTPRAIGPRAGRALLVQTLLAVLTGGLATKLVADLIAVLCRDGALRRVAAVQ